MSPPPPPLTGLIGLSNIRDHDEPATTSSAAAGRSSVTIGPTTPSAPERTAAAAMAAMVFFMMFPQEVLCGSVSAYAKPTAERDNRLRMVDARTV